MILLDRVGEGQRQAAGVVGGQHRVPHSPADGAAARDILANMHIAELNPVEQRVLGCLIEKRWTTPDQYPLSLNGLRLACNQSTNRDPVTSYDEAEVREAAQRLCLYGLARLASGHGSRAVKYRHLAEEALGLNREELGLLAVLLLRGPQTPGELKSRSERLSALVSLADVERVLDALVEHGYVRRLGRRPGQKEDRFEHLLGGAAGAEPGGTGAGTTAPTGTGQSGTGPGPTPLAPAPAPPLLGRHPASLPAVPPSPANLADRVAALEAEVASLRAELEALRQAS